VRTLRDLVMDGGHAAISARRHTVRVGVAIGKAGIAMNRRKPGSGTVDDSLGVVVFENARSGKPIAVLGNCACHPVVMGEHSLQVSADYPGVAQREVEAETGATCFFLNGACGDINPVVAHSSDFDDVITLGGQLARGMLKLARKPTWLDDTRLDSRWRNVRLPVRVPRNDRELRDRFKRVTEAFRLPENLFADREEKYRRWMRDGRFPRAIEAPVSMIRIGHALAIVFLPGEVFSEIGLKIKAMSPHLHTFVAGYSNGAVGYLPTRKAYAKGGYEPYLAPLFYGFPEFDPSVEDVLLGAVRQLLTARRGARK
jgi:hypothetical protein